MTLSPNFNRLQKARYVHCFLYAFNNVNYSYVYINLYTHGYYDTNEAYTLPTQAHNLTVQIGCEVNLLSEL